MFVKVFKSKRTRIGIVIYSSRSRRVISFAQGGRRATVLRIINRIRYIGGRSYTGRALYYVKKRLFYGRPHCGRKRVLIVISGAISRDRIMRPSKGLTTIGVETFVIVTNVKAFGKLQVIATTRTHVFVTTYTAMRMIVKKLTIKICNSPRGEPSFESVLFVFLNIRYLVVVYLFCLFVWLFTFMLCEARRLCIYLFIELSVLNFRLFLFWAE